VAYQPLPRAPLAADLRPGKTLEQASQPRTGRPQVRPPDAHRPVFCRLHLPRAKVIVEVDGGTHSTAKEVANDARRTLHLKQLGYRVFRVCNDDIYHNLDTVLALLAFIEAPR
jgi:Protein of unknown function (DUF559)